MFKRNKDVHGSAALLVASNTSKYHHHAIVTSIPFTVQCQIKSFFAKEPTGCRFGCLIVSVIYQEDSRVSNVLECLFRHYQRHRIMWSPLLGFLQVLQSASWLSVWSHVWAWSLTRLSFPLFVLFGLVWYGFLLSSPSPFSRVKYFTPFKKFCLWGLPSLDKSEIRQLLWCNIIEHSPRFRDTWRRTA